MRIEWLIIILDVEYIVLRKCLEYEYIVLNVRHSRIERTT